MAHTLTHSVAERMTIAWLKNKCQQSLKQSS